VSETHNPLRHSEFRRLFAAQVIALVGAGLATVALALLAYDMSGSSAGQVLGTALAIKMLAYVLFAPIAGAIAHRLPRRTFLVSLDIARAAIVVAMPFATTVSQIYFLIFLLSTFSAAFKPVFSATIPDVLEDEAVYTRALSYTRIAYDLETLLSPALAGLALLVMSFHGLFVANGIAFLISAALIALTAFPASRPVERAGNSWAELSFGVAAYLRTPRLRALLVLYLGVAVSSAMIIVNTVIYVRNELGGTDSATALAFAATGAGSMLAALLLPGILEKQPERRIMLIGMPIMAAAMAIVVTMPGQWLFLIAWLLAGVGMSLVQTPAGRVVNRSAQASDRPAYFSAQFALSHACWLVAYPLVGQLGAKLGFEQTSMVVVAVILGSAVAGALLWPSSDGSILRHRHEPVDHQHLHTHDEHHGHLHDGTEGPEPHRHAHRHTPIRHRHKYVIDDHHTNWPQT
jgi:MFS family permease